MKNKVTLPDKVLLSAYHLLDKKKIFSAEDLTVKSFELFPDDFSLPGYKSVPNSNKIYTFVMGKDAALIRKGFIKKIGEKQYKISDAGLSYVESNLLSSNDIKKNKSKINTTRNDMLKMKNFFDNKITKIILSKNEIDGLDFDDVCSFWRISSTVTYPDLVEKFSQLDTWFNTLKDMFKKTGNKIIEIDSNTLINKKHLNNLISAHEKFKIKFEKQISYIKKQRPNPVRN
mgnify:CR=1 FL=1